MQNLLSALLVGGMALAASAASAAERIVTFGVDNMTCGSCPYIVKTSMTAVGGVHDVAISLEAKTVTVTFDDAKTTAELIGAASTNAGYPAHLQQGS
jgi:mercuric ion binding protein